MGGNTASENEWVSTEKGNASQNSLVKQRET